MFVKHRKMVKYLKFRISKLHLQLKLLLGIAYLLITFLNKFLPARLLGPTRLLDVTTISYLHGYLDSTVHAGLFRTLE